MATDYGGNGDSMSVMDRASSINQSGSPRGGAPSFVTPNHAQTKARGSSGGLSELSKQLRVMQAKNTHHVVEIDRLERQLKILADMQGISIADLRSALQTACESEAHGELQNRVSSLRAQLEAATISKDTKKFEAGASEAHVANLQLRVGELEEIEETLREEIDDLYSKLHEQTSKVSQLQATCEGQSEKIEKLKESSTESGSSPHSLESSHALIPIQTPGPYGSMSAADVKVLTGEARTAKAEAKMERVKATLLGTQLEARESELKLKTAQYKARFMVQDERINDLEQQLSSLYTAFELLRQEQRHEELKRVSLEESLHSADAQVARDIERHNNSRRATAARIAKEQGEITKPSKSPNTVSSHGSYVASPPGHTAAKPPPLRQSVSATSVSASNNELVAAGNLTVRSNEVVKRWKKRYVALYRSFSGCTLTMNDGTRAVVSKTYSLVVGVSCARPNKQFSPKFPFAFVIHVDPRDRAAPVIHAATSTEESLQKWLSELKSVLGTSEAGSDLTGLKKQEAADLEAALRLSAEDR